MNIQDMLYAKIRGVDMLYRLHELPKEAQLRAYNEYFKAFAEEGDFRSFEDFTLTCDNADMVFTYGGKMI
jgi:hypothetical protein